MSTLYELTGQMLQLQDILAEEDNEEYVQTVLDTMEGLDFEIELKADNYARIIRNLTADVEGLKTEIDRLSSRKKSVENNIAALKTRLEYSMIQLGKEKFKTELFSFGIQNNPPKVVIDEPDLIPSAYLIPQPPKPDVAKIKEYLNGEGKGFELWAHIEQGRSLRIR